jgi:hypothetical protein
MDSNHVRRRMVSCEASLERPTPLLVGRHALLYFGVFALALSLRLFAIGNQNLWHDEHMSLRVASATSDEMPVLLRTLESNKPPLYFTLLHYWLSLGSSEFWLRFPSALAGSLGCVAAVAIGRQLLGGPFGAWLGVWMAFSPFHIYYSQEARPFAMWGTLMAIALLFHLKFCAKPRTAYLLLYVVFATLACYTFTYAVFIIAFSCIFGLTYRPRLAHRALVALAAANVAIFLLYAPWLYRVVSSLSSGEGVQVHRRGPAVEAAAYSFVSLAFGTSFGPSVESLRLLGRRVFHEAPASAALLVLGGILLGIVVLFGLAHLWKANRTCFYFAVFGVAVFLGTPAVLNFVKPEIPNNPRYAFPAIIPMGIMLVAAWMAPYLHVRWRSALGCLFALATSVSLGNHYFNPAYARDDLRSAATFIRGLAIKPEQIVVCAGHLAEVFSFYYRGESEIVPLTLDVPDEKDSRLEATLRRLTGVKHLVLVYSRPDHGDPERIVPTTLQARFHLLEHRHWTGVDVYEFARLENDLPPPPNSTK